LVRLIGLISYDGDPASDMLTAVLASKLRLCESVKMVKRVACIRVCAMYALK